jgi:putative membrane protein
MQFTFSQKAILAFTILYVLGFGVYFLKNFNIEFIGYVVLMFGIFGVLYGTLHKTKFPTYILAGISIWGLMHMMGGSIQTADGVLYTWRIFPFYDGGGEFFILKFDQVVHAFLYGVVALMFLHLLNSYFRIQHSRALVFVIAVMAALGVSAVNEMVEFVAVLTVPGNGVGGYYNTLLDIIFNFSGAVVALLFYTVFSKHKR